MDSKLTLKLDKATIEKAKKYAKRKNISLSRMIENYLMSLTKKNDELTDISPLVESLTGIIELNDGDYKKDYTDYLTEKYK